MGWALRDVGVGVVVHLDRKDRDRPREHEAEPCEPTKGIMPHGRSALPLGSGQDPRNTARSEELTHRLGDRKRR